MAVKVEIKFGDKRLSYETESDRLYQLVYVNKIVKLPDQLRAILIIKDLIITQTEESKSDFKLLSKKSASNIDAYNWNGEHLWNISDIIGEKKISFYDLRLTSAEELVKDGVLESYSVEGVDLLLCSAHESYFIIDPVNRKVVARRLLEF